VVSGEVIRRVERNAEVARLVLAKPDMTVARSSAG